MLENIRIVLIETSHPGNIGGVARAMKTMGLKNLCLINPKLFPHQKANEMASSAVDVLENAVLVKNLDEALADCHLIVGTSARARTIPWPMLSPRQLAEKIKTESSTMQTAILFGREQSGLTNEELHRCHFHVQIPSHHEYSALNIAAAVQVIAYELYLASLMEGESTEWDYALGTAQELEGLYVHLEKVLVALDFLNPKAPRQLMTRLRRLFNRARLDVMEINILRGILGSVDKWLGGG
ncbi:MAG TPA: tRNA (cytosine(32)/uridine(32)-2'-O)-methyltransferase TrmJ [Gammaproteobacteria bacterium]|nr:tRNA (cytosine(32)/uridine(32)-2'-O)-methyltransferase TrmJ [Gammaproteobacteria bacterium]